MNYCWAWTTSCEVDWPGWAGAVMNALAILASTGIAVFIPWRERQSNRADACDAANTAMVEAVKRLTMVAYTASRPQFQFARHANETAPFKIADEMLASASLLNLGSHLARAQMISMREHVRTIAAHFADIGEDRNLIISTVADSAWQSLHAFQAALNFQRSSRDEEEMEIDRLLTALQPIPT